MPLIHSASSVAFKKNLEKELAAGKPHAVAVAIASRIRDESRKKRGGKK